MQRREFLASSVALALAGAVGRPVLAAVPADEAARARALYDPLFDEILAVAPQRATSLGLDVGPRAAARSRLN
jgi:uncharacterized protein (DUF885 family)